MRWKLPAHSSRGAGPFAPVGMPLSGASRLGRVCVSLCLSFQAQILPPPGEKVNAQGKPLGREQCERSMV